LKNGRHGVTRSERNEAIAFTVEVWCHSACNIDPLSRGIGVQNWL
jgi:hypothetical protein